MKYLKINIVEDDIRTSIHDAMDYFKEMFGCIPTTIYLGRDTFAIFKKKVTALYISNATVIKCDIDSISKFRYSGCEIKSSSKLNDSELYIREDADVSYA